ncbi:MAG: hypothetical protein FWF72_01600 [Paludibacter sp.]|nr:hypothetical protein [Paludibacter sp.]
MKAKTVFTQIIQPKLIQYMIDHYGKSYDKAFSEFSRYAERKNKMRKKK